MEATSASTLIRRTALKYDLQVLEDGRLEFNVPLAPGSRVTVFVIEEPLDGFEDLVSASQSSLDFWNNPFDDEDWNHA
jgi:hypothetical protein